MRFVVVNLRFCFQWLINPERVVAISANEDGTSRIHFGVEDSIEVKHTPEELLTLFGAEEEKP